MQVYSGETKGKLKFCLAEHRGDVGINNTTATHQHFNSPGPTIAALCITLIQQVKKKKIFKEEKEKKRTYEDSILGTME